MTRRQIVGLVTALALTVPVAVSIAWAGSSASEQLRASVDRVLRTVEDPDLKRPARVDERRSTVRRIAGEIFDFTEITKRVLGPHWQPRTPAEREEIVRLFTALLERAYISKIELYSGERIAYVGETVDGELAAVRTRLITKQGTEIPVDYRMVRRGERWMAYDVVIEGVSLVANYRGQFNKILQTSSYAELVRRLRAKLDEQQQAESDGSPRRTSQGR
jgi:phospholipid transport system substrate-binding protein